MMISKLRIENFRSFKDQTITIGALASLIGDNGAGKSTVLAALNVLFRNSAAPTDVLSLGREDFHCECTASPVVISATFTDLSEEAKNEFRHYVRNDTLIVITRAA